MGCVLVMAGLALVTSNGGGPGVQQGVRAVDPASGQVVWRFDPGMQVSVAASGPAGLAVATYVPAARRIHYPARRGCRLWPRTPLQIDLDHRSVPRHANETE
jgi:hypothetical protein